MPIQLGRHSYVDANGAENRFCGEIRVGNFSAIAAHTRFLGGTQALHLSATRPEVVSSFPFEILRWEYPRDPITKPIVLGNDVWIGTGVTVLRSVTIGDGAIVGAGAVVTKDVAPYCVVGGIPAKPIRFRFDPDTIAALLRIRWWDWPDDKIKANLQKMLDVAAFVKEFDV